MNDLPIFDTPSAPIEPPAPRKPRQKPQRRKKRAKAPVIVPKRRVPKKRAKPMQRVEKTPRLFVLMNASESIATLLEPLSAEERSIVLRSPRIAKLLP